jgi:hypothetical protein
MKNKHHFFIALSVLSLLVVSCKKKDEETEETPSPSTPQPVVTITINQPTEGTTIEFADTAFIDFSIEADVEMHGYEAYLINESTNDTVWEADSHSHANLYSYSDTWWINNVADHSDMQFKVIAEIDHDGNTREKTVHFHAHPFE